MEAFLSVPGSHRIDMDGRPMHRHRRVCSPRMGPWKPGEKEEAFKKQQEILARRRNKNKTEEYFKTVEKRRETMENARKERQLVVKEGEDPIVAWRELKEKGLLSEAGYPDEQPGGSAEGGIPLPMASFGIPKYDQGGRFDLRLPHVEVGYTDESADVMGKLAHMFGFRKKQNPKIPPEN